MRKILALSCCVLFSSGAVAGSSLGGEAAPALCEAIRKAPPNTWVKIDEKAPGTGRSYGKITYLPGEKKFLLYGGYAGRLGAYEEIVFDPASGKWSNFFPVGKKLGPASGGPITPPAGGRTPFGKDSRYHLRLNWFGVPAAYNQCALDAKSRQIYVHWFGVTARYSVKDRGWKELKPGTAPGIDKYYKKGAYDPGPKLRWGAMCFMPQTGEVLLANTSQDAGSTGTWIYSPAKNQWTRLKLGKPEMNKPHAQIAALHVDARDLVALCRNRYYLTESPTRAKADLGKRMKELSAELTGLKLPAGSDDYQRTQVKRARVLLEKARVGAGQLVAKLKVRPDAGIISEVQDVVDALRRARNALGAEPPPRCMSPLVWHPIAKKAVMFGGDGHNRFYADTWAFDPAKRRWEELRPGSGPAPRAGHAMVWLPRARKLLLLGRSYAPHPGRRVYTTQAFEMWAYDLAANRWGLVRRYAAQKAPPHNMSRAGLSTFAAAPGDLVVGQGRSGYMGRDASTWACRVDAGKLDAAGTSKHAVPAGSESTFGGGDDPRAYDRVAGSRPAAMAAKLKSLPANQWVRIWQRGKHNSPALEKRGPGWGACRFDPVGNQFLWWMGGHSDYCGNVVHHYSVRTGRWNLGYAPSHALNAEQSNDGIVGTDFHGRPWQIGHPWGRYGYDPRSKRLVVTLRRTHTYDPVLRKWDAQSYATRGGNMGTTPHGLMTAGRKGVVYRFQMGKGWLPLKQTGKLRGVCGYAGSFAYDSKRDRLLIVPRSAPLYAYEFKTGQVKKLPNRNIEAVKSIFTCEQARDAVYLPGADLVLYSAGSKGFHVIYDVAKDTWRGVKLAPENIVRGHHSNALIGDPERGLVYAMTGSSAIYALRFDPATAKFVELPGKKGK
jgi:Galactose oxidase, central domain